MHGDDVGPGFGEIFDIGIDRRDHQMHVERFRTVRAQRLHDRGADRQVRDEMPVHDIDMDVIRPGGVNCAHLLAQFGEIGGKDRRRDTNGLLHGHSRFRGAKTLPGQFITNPYQWLNSGEMC